MLLPSGKPFKCHEEVCSLWSHLLTFVPLAGGCSKGLDAFRFFSKYTYCCMCEYHKTLYNVLVSMHYAWGINLKLLPEGVLITIWARRTGKFHQTFSHHLRGRWWHITHYTWHLTHETWDITHDTSRYTTKPPKPRLDLSFSKMFAHPRRLSC